MILIHQKKKKDSLDSFVPEYNSWTVPFNQSSENQSSIFSAVNVVWFSNKLLLLLLNQSDESFTKWTHWIRVVSESALSRPGMK